MFSQKKADFGVPKPGLTREKNVTLPCKNRIQLCKKKLSRRPLIERIEKVRIFGMENADYGNAESSYGVATGARLHPVVRRRKSNPVPKVIVELDSKLKNMSVWMA